jgi:hypothetical protein
MLFELFHPVKLNLCPLGEPTAQNPNRLPGLHDPAAGDHIVQGDAASYSFSNETVVFMLDPFGWKTFKIVIANLKQSLEKNPRVLRIAYYGPYADFLDAEPWLAAQGEIGKTEIKVWKAA